MISKLQLQHPTRLAEQFYSYSSPQRNRSLYYQLDFKV